MTTQNQVQQVSEEGLQALKDQLATHERDFAELRSKLVELRQVKDADDFDLVEDTVRLAFLEKEIVRLQHVIAHCKIIEADPSASSVQIGSKVRLEYSGGELHCKVVTPLEADPSEGRISDQSPLGRALLGKMLNALVEVVTPRARQHYKIVAIDR